MLEKIDGFQRSPVTMVIAPLIVLTAVSAFIALSIFLSDKVDFLSATGVLISGILIYAITIVLLGNYSLSNVRQLEKLSLSDSLCGLPNRRALHADIHHLRASNDEIALALIDLDGFKQINDHFGHFIGDQLIRECADILRDLCKDEAYCYRLGGDEFAIIMIGPLAGTILEGMCRNLVSRLSNPIPLGERRITIGASVGLTRATSGEVISSAELLRRADVAMYASKNGGKMRCTWFNSAFDRNREANKQMDDDLREALETEQFTIAYQPVIDADNAKISGVEALIRWTMPNGERISPGAFIPMAEETGLINPIGLFMLKCACSDALQWNDLTLSVNISVAQLRNPEFPIKLGEILEDTGFPPNRLELEITETCLVHDPKVAERSLGVIRGLGVKISLDDFGTGYASIGFLRQFQFEKLKLDRTLVVQAEEDESSRAVMLSSIAVARALKMTVTAEGVETEQQAQLVKMAGCDLIQGWFYYKAMKAESITNLINSIALSEQANARSVGSDTK